MSNLDTLNLKFDILKLTKKFNSHLAEASIGKLFSDSRLLMSLFLFLSIDVFSTKREL